MKEARENVAKYRKLLTEEVYDAIRSVVGNSESWSPSDSVGPGLCWDLTVDIRYNTTNDTWYCYVFNRDGYLLKSKTDLYGHNSVEEVIKAIINSGLDTELFFKVHPQLLTLKESK